VGRCEMSSDAKQGFTSFSTRRKSSITLWIFDELSSFVRSANAIINLQIEGDENDEKEWGVRLSKDIFFLFFTLLNAL
jgi:hypothetical protein